MAYVPSIRGQIVSIRLRNFMSYDDIVLRPGFRLNLIIGPNGTGKSTFVCAVVLGLGGKLKALGRADQLSAYVKNGCNESIIDIELYEPNFENVVITRKIYSNNHSEYYINDRAVSGAKVNDVRVQYNIQLDNLCTFLPQEKVQDFSKLNPQQLLDQTQKTVGCDDMISSYEQLKNLRHSLKNGEKLNGTLEEQIDDERQKNDRLKDKVKSFLEKRALCEKLTLINQKKSWLGYHNELQRVKEIAKDCKLAEEKFAEKKRKLASLSQDMKVVEERVKNSQENFYKSKRDWSAKKSVIEDGLKRIRERLGRFEDFDNIVQSKMAEEDYKKLEVQQYQENLDKLKNDLHTFELKNGSDEQLRAKEGDIGKELIKIHEVESKLTEKKVGFEDELEQLKRDLRNASTECRLLEKRKNFRLEYIKRYEPDVYESVEWLKEHSHIFQGRIYNPMLLELDVTNSKTAKYVEARIGYRDLISFTCTNPDDLNLLIEKLRIERKLKINAICSDDDDISRFCPEIPLNQIRALGFFSYMKELITGPNHIIRYLCKVYKIHCIPIGDERVKSKCDRVPTCIPIFFSENHMFTVKVSVYSGDKSINVRQLSEPKLFSASMDNEKMQRLQKREKELQSAVEEKEAKLKLLTQELKASVDALERMRQKKRDLATLYEEKKGIIVKLKRTEQNLKNIQSTLRDPSVILEEAEKERMSLRKDVNRSFQDLRKLYENFEGLSNLKQEYEMKHKISRFKINAMLKVKERYSGEVNKLQGTLNSIRTVKEESEVNCRKLKEAARKLTNGLAAGERGFEKFEKEFRTLKSTVEELETEMQETQVMVDFLHGGNAQVLQEYQKREEEIAKLQVSLEHSRNNLKELQDKMAALQEKWLVPINELVSKINENFGNFFETMGCVGEVSLVTGENKDDFEQYGIVIRVKFRAEVPLQNLGRHFQSGGERAVATAVYLLSLQELICVPFRFVDEINQGMDSANERRIMNLMVRVTAQEKSTQYFFITPKLLPDIECSETMAVHCIYSGHKAISSENWNLKKFLSAC